MAAATALHLAQLGADVVITDPARSRTNLHVHTVGLGDSIEALGAVAAAPAREPTADACRSRWTRSAEPTTWPTVVRLRSSWRVSRRVGARVREKCGASIALTAEHSEPIGAVAVRVDYRFWANHPACR